MVKDRTGLQYRIFVSTLISILFWALMVLPHLAHSQKLQIPLPNMKRGISSNIIPKPIGRTYSVSVDLANTPWPMYRHDIKHSSRSPYQGPQSPKLDWAFRTGDEIQNQAAIGPDGTIYFGSMDNNLYALNPDGSLKWSFPTDDNVNCTPAIASDGTIYWGNWEKYFYATNPDGSLKWKLDVGGPTGPSSPAIGQDGTIYIGVSYVGTYNDGYLYAINPDGSIKWTLKLGSADCAFSSPAIGPDGTIYIVSIDIIYLWFSPENMDYYLHAVDSNGHQKWEYYLGRGDVEWDAPPSPVVGADGSIYVGSRVGWLYALTPEGSLKWKFSVGDDYISSPLIGSDGTLYVGTSNNTIYALDPNNGSIKWSLSPETRGWISCEVIGSDGIFYATCEDGYLYAIDSNTHSIKWYFSVDSVLDDVIIGSNNTLYAGGNVDGYLYSIGQSDKCYVNSFKIVNPLVPGQKGEIRVVLSAGCDNKRGLRLRIGDLTINSPIEEGNRTYLFSFDIPDKWVNSLQEAELTVDIRWDRDYHYKQDLVIEEEAQGCIENLIYDYAPILEFAQDETYFPVRVETVFKEATYKPTDGYPECQVTKNLLATRGSKEAKIKVSGEDIKGSKNGIVIYATCKKQHNRLAVQYWFHYAYDPKGWFDAPAEHNGDWEMITIVFDENYSPLYVAFAEHRRNQRIECIEGECLKKLPPGIKWTSGGVRIPWGNVDKKGNHPIVYVAEGSHASYPYAGEWDVDIIYIQKEKNHRKEEIWTGHEIAGGGAKWYPDGSKVIPLPRLSKITSTHDYGWLLFSGVYYNDWIPLGLENDEEGKEYKAKLIDIHNIKFPPYQEEKWLKPIDWAESLFCPFKPKPMPWLHLLLGE